MGGRGDDEVTPETAAMETFGTMERLLNDWSAEFHATEAALKWYASAPKEITVNQRGLSLGFL